MQEEYVINIENVTKKFKVFYDKGQTFKERLLFKNRTRYEDRWVLKGVSFQVKKGEAIGLIGENGCGKSTLLKMMSKIMYPDTGSISIKGRVSSLIELGAGFHPDMSGRENIYTNASIFGLNRKEIDERLEAIIDFSELREFIDNPVRTYSSGMYMRLAFAVAINVDADVLLIDEILAVGDAAFQAKCFNKLREIKASGTTIVIVSHSMGQIEQICERSYWIDGGLIREEGTPRDVHPLYLSYMGNKNAVQEDENAANEMDCNAAEEEDESGEKQEKTKRCGDRSIVILGVRLLNSEGKEVKKIKVGDSVDIEISYKKNNPNITDAITGIGIFRTDGLNCYGSNTHIDRIERVPLKEKGKVICHIAKVNLLPSEYVLDVAFHKEDGFNFDYWKECKKFETYSEYQDAGIVKLEHNWRYE